MTDSIIAQHAPAIKVAGRRLSVTTKQKPHRPEDRIGTESEKKKEDNEDYPRPSPSTTADAPIQHDHGHNYEEEVPHKKEKKPNSERKTQEYEYYKGEATRPTRDHNVGQKAQNIRISQPTGKGFNA